MRGSRIAQLINAVHNRVERSVVTDGCIRSPKVIIDSAGKTNDRHIKLLSKLTSTCKGAISAYHYKRINAGFLHVVIRFLAALRITKLRTTSRLEDGATTLNNTRYIVRCEFADITIYQSLIPTIDAHHFYSIVDSSARDSANSCIHSWRITA